MRAGILGTAVRHQIVGGGARRVVADGTSKPNRRGKAVMVRSPEDHLGVLCMQTTGVEKPLMRFTRICVVGNQVHGFQGRRRLHSPYGARPRDDVGPVDTGGDNLGIFRCCT